MKKVNFVGIGLLFISSICLSSCQKEHKIEKNLRNKGGDWNIESLVANQVSTNPVDNFDETILNYGTYFFKKDGIGSFKFTVDGDVEIGDFIYNNSDDKITFIVNGQVRVLDLTWEKDKIKMTIVENYTSNGETIKYTETYNLIKN